MTNLYLQEDPAQVGDFLIDEDNNAFNLEDKTAYVCDFCNTQLKSNEGWLYCPNKCNEENDI